MKLWRYIMDYFLDFQACENMASTCKHFYKIAGRSHFERVQKWMINGLTTEKRYNLMQNYLILNTGNGYLEVNSNLLSLFYQRLGFQDKKVILTVMKGINKFKSPYSFFLNIICRVNKKIQFSDIKELVFSVNYNFNDNINFGRIQSVFPNIEVLQLEFNWLLELPFTSEEVFSAIPSLNKLIIRITESDAPFYSREDLATFLRMLTDKRVELKFVTRWIPTNQVVIWAFGIFNSELEKEEKEFKMKNRAFFGVLYNDMISKTIGDNVEQVHSLAYSTENENDSFDVVFGKIGIFTQLEKLRLDFTNGVASSDLKISGLKPFAKLAHLYLICNAPQCISLLSSLHFVFPNLAKLRVVTSIRFDLLFESLFQLKKLEELVFLNSKATRKCLQIFLQAIANGSFPILRDLSLTELDHDENSDRTELVSVYRQLVIRRPLLRIWNTFLFLEQSK